MSNNDEVIKLLEEAVAIVSWWRERGNRRKDVEYNINQALSLLRSQETGSYDVADLYEEKPCDTCGGSGQVDDTIHSVNAGIDIKKPCETCGGTKKKTHKDNFGNKLYSCVEACPDCKDDVGEKPKFRLGSECLDLGCGTYDERHGYHLRCPVCYEMDKVLWRKLQQEKAEIQTKCLEFITELNGKADALLKLNNEKFELQQENKRLGERDCNANIQLCYNDGNNPFAIEDLKVVDVGVSDNVYVVESKIVAELQAENKRLREAYRHMRNAAAAATNYIPNNASLSQVEKLMVKAEQALKENDNG